MYKIEKIGRGNITARIIADSIYYNENSALDTRITTFELEYPRFVHAELMTHRMFSRNAASSRAIPIEKMCKLVETNIAMPILWNKNQKGMQSHDLFDVDSGDVNGWVIDPYDDDAYPPNEAWEKARDSAVSYARAFDKAGHHKQTANRLIEPFQMIKVIVTATSFENWFNLRFQSFEDYDAQHEIHELSKVMYECYNETKPVELNDGDWHTPYYKDGYYKVDGSEAGYTLDDALKISCSCCAQVSYRNLNDSLEKALSMYDTLVFSDPVHASAFEHCATPITESNVNDVSVTHMKRVFTYDEDGNVTIEPYVVYGSGNFDNWIQYRQTIPNHVCNKFELKKTYSSLNDLLKSEYDANQQ